MAWERRRGTNNLYYTRTFRRPGGRVFRQYIGTGRVAQIAAREDALCQAERQEAARAFRVLIETVTGAERLAETYTAGCRLLMAATLLLEDCYDHQGTWRKRPGKCTSHWGR